MLVPETPEVKRPGTRRSSRRSTLISSKALASDLHERAQKKAKKGRKSDSVDLDDTTRVNETPNSTLGDLRRTYVEETPDERSIRDSILEARRPGLLVGASNGLASTNQGPQGAARHPIFNRSGASRCILYI